MNLKFSQRILLINFWVLLLAAILMVLLYETEMLEPGTLLFDGEFVFLMQVIMEFLTIAVIPLALKLFAFKAVKRKLVNGTLGHSSHQHAVLADVGQYLHVLPDDVASFRLYGNHPFSVCLLHIPIHGEMCV